MKKNVDRTMAQRVVDWAATQRCQRSQWKHRSCRTIRRRFLEQCAPCGAKTLIQMMKEESRG